MELPGSGAPKHRDWPWTKAGARLYTTTQRRYHEQPHASLCGYKGELKSTLRLLTCGPSCGAGHSQEAGIDIDEHNCPNREGVYVRITVAQVHKWIGNESGTRGERNMVGRCRTDEARCCTSQDTGDAGWNGGLTREMRHLTRIRRQHTLLLAKRLVWPRVDSPNILRVHEPGAA
jgi:hypothetical protein